MADAKQKVNPVDPGSDEAREVRREFGELVTMTAKQLSEWLETEAPRAVGQKDGDGESVGHDSGRRIVGILGKKAGDLSAEDLAHMKKTVAYVKRHLRQRPDKPRSELEDAPWTSSLRNWGHDPLA